MSDLSRPVAPAEVITASVVSETVPNIGDALPGDIYVDPNGKLWRVIAIFRDPTVEVEEVEGTLFDPNVARMFHQGAVGMGVSASAAIQKRRLSGGISGLMWVGFKRIWRNAQ